MPLDGMPPATFTTRGRTGAPSIRITTLLRPPHPLPFRHLSSLRVNKNCFSEKIWSHKKTDDLDRFTSSHSGDWLLCAEALATPVPPPRRPTANDLQRPSAARSASPRAAATSLGPDDHGRRVRLQHDEQRGDFAGAAAVVATAFDGEGGDGGGQGLRGRLLHLDRERRLRHKADPGVRAVSDGERGTEWREGRGPVPPRTVPGWRRREPLCDVSNEERGTSRLFVRPRPTATVDHLFSPKFMPRCARRERNNG